jgi:hypothetical protein
LCYSTRNWQSIISPRLRLPRSGTLFRRPRLEFATSGTAKGPSGHPTRRISALSRGKCSHHLEEKEENLLSSYDLGCAIPQVQIVAHFSLPTIYSKCMFLYMHTLQYFSEKLLIPLLVRHTFSRINQNNCQKATHGGNLSWNGQLQHSILLSEYFANLTSRISS